MVVEDAILRKHQTSKAERGWRTRHRQFNSQGKTRSPLAPGHDCVIIHRVCPMAFLHTVWCHKDGDLLGIALSEEARVRKRF
jgi:hypothetical protein